MIDISRPPWPVQERPRSPGRTDPVRRTRAMCSWSFVRRSSTLHTTGVMDAPAIAVNPCRDKRIVNTGEPSLPQESTSRMYVTQYRVGTLRSMGCSCGSVGCSCNVSGWVRARMQAARRCSWRRGRCLGQRGSRSWRPRDRAAPTPGEPSCTMRSRTIRSRRQPQAVPILDRELPARPGVDGDRLDLRLPGGLRVQRQLCGDHTC